MASERTSGLDPLTAFEAVDVRAGTVVEAAHFEGGRTSTHVLLIDLGPAIGRKKSLARLPTYGDPAALVGRQVLCLTGLEPRQVGPHMSEVLTLAVPDAEGDTALVVPDRHVPDGGRLY